MASHFTGGKRTLALLALGVSLLTTPLAAQTPEPGLTDKTIKIGMFAPLSGANMAYGFDVANAAKMYYDKINKEGGIHGRKIEVVLEDDRCNANDLVAAVKKLTEQDTGLHPQRRLVLGGGGGGKRLCRAQQDAAGDAQRIR